MSNDNDLTLYKIAFDETGYLNLVKTYINQGLDILSGYMHDVLVQAIVSCSQSSGVMKGATVAHVRELSRTVTDSSAEIEVGVDPGEASGEQDYIRVMVTLFGNGEVWARVGGSGWTKDVGGINKNHVLTDWHITQFEQGDHSDAMMDQFDKDIQKYADDFLDMITKMIQSIDLSQFLLIGG